jgi:outer membrane lipoprotein-sorting protein
MVTYTPDGKPMNTMTYSDIKINDKISPDRFVFKAPPGVEVQDLSK